MARQRDATCRVRPAAGALSVICSWASASCTVDAVGPYLPAVLAVERESAAALLSAQHDRIRLMHPGVGGWIEVVAFADIEAVLGDDIDHTGLHRGNSHLRGRRRSA